jgi:hypothetical protein
MVWGVGGEVICRLTLVDSWVGSALAGNCSWFSLGRFQAFFRFLGSWGYQVFLAPGSATLDAFGIDTVYVKFQGKVSLTSRARFGSD